eukprot:s1255_g3.t2
MVIQGIGQQRGFGNYTGLGAFEALMLKIFLLGPNAKSFGQAQVLIIMRLMYLHLKTGGASVRLWGLSASVPKKWRKSFYQNKTCSCVVGAMSVVEGCDLPEHFLMSTGLSPSSLLTQLQAATAESQQLQEQVQHLQSVIAAKDSEHAELMRVADHVKQQDLPPPTLRLLSPFAWSIDRGHADDRGRGGRAPSSTADALHPSPRSRAANIPAQPRAVYCTPSSIDIDWKPGTASGGIWSITELMAEKDRRYAELYHMVCQVDREVALRREAEKRLETATAVSRQAVAKASEEALRAKSEADEAWRLWL